MLNLVDAPEPPVHLVLGSEAIGMLKNADEFRANEMEKWMDVSLSTDHAGANNFLDTQAGKMFLSSAPKAE